MITGFFVLIVFYLAYRLNRDESLIILLERRISKLENSLKFSDTD